MEDRQLLRRSRPLDRQTGHGVFLVFCIVRFVATGVIVRVQRRASQSIEHLCDLYAAARAGSGPMINVLLKSGEEEELVETVLARAASELRGVGGLELEDLVMAFEEVRPVGRIFHDNLFRHASQVFGKLQEERKQRHGRKADGGNPELEAFVKYRRQAGGERIRWRDFDKDGDGGLADDEMAELVAALRRQPERMLFRCEGERNPTSHPAYRERILALSECPMRAASG